MPESENLAVQILLYGFSAASVVVTVVATLLWKSLEKTRCREIKGLEAQALSKEGKAAELQSMSLVLSALQNSLSDLQKEISDGLKQISIEHSQIQGDHDRMWERIKPKERN